ncbi:S49 family peptidase [Kaistia nematophila]|uniref:S49 family peptidase n=1 Tax=Kaistia nematophila TaxID=2994654 RepID=A0A9X3ILP8_9HYPH|nr:S49 family peptidase [Kaistia nematophila]MCX5570904.1 S49 family peptidase [Kaistia nematophila]
MSAIRKRLPARFRKEEMVVPVVRLAGVIGAVSQFRTGLTLSGVAPLLERAFAMKQAPVVGIVINSPGGSPVQSHLIFKRIRALAEENKKDVIIAVEDVAASGGYLIALAGDVIIVDPSSVVGSIGVVSAGFGFEKLIEKIGVERRVYTAGESKAMLDPFKPEKESDVQHLKSLQRDVHDMFIDLVRARRGERLADDPTLFSGAFWSGARGLELGLVDRIGDLRSYLRGRFGDKVRMVLVAPKRGVLARFGGGGAGGLASAAIADNMVESAVSKLEERAHWSRFGL